MRQGLAVALGLLMLTVGCLEVSTGDEVDPQATSDDTVPAPAFTAPTAVSKDQPGAEPVLDIASDGTLFVQGIGSETREPTGVGLVANNVWRSTDDGQSWEDVTPPADGGQTSADAVLFVDDQDNVHVANSVSAGYMAIWRSTDSGDSWDRIVHVPLPGPMHRVWMAQASDGTLHTLIYSLIGGGDAKLGAWHMRSTDHGETWTVPSLVSRDLVFGTDLETDPDGTLYTINLPGQNQGQWTLFRSSDAGETWETVDLWSVETSLESSFQSLAIDDAGTLYFHWAERRDGTARVFHAASTDGGDTWTGPTKLLDAGASRTLPWAEARAPGEVSLIWYGADTPGIPAEHDTEWYLDHALITQAETATPQVTTTRITPEPIHTGTLCNDGPSCQQGENRELLDFPWIAMGPDDRAHLAFASTTWERSSAFPLYAAERLQTAEVLEEGGLGAAGAQSPVSTAMPRLDLLG